MHPTILTATGDAGVLTYEVLQETYRNMQYPMLSVVRKSLADMPLGEQLLRLAHAADSHVSMDVRAASAFILSEMQSDG